jgi:hypothetical protein
MSEFRLATVGASNGAADLVFVHGLTGDFVTTWTAPHSGEPSGDYWPKWIYEDLPSLNVYTLGYPASLFESWAKKEMGLYDRAKASLDYLASYGFGRRPIGFVTHSLGGLLVKEMIRTGTEAPDRAFQSIAKACRLVIFLATPHTGASLASAFTLAFPRLSSKHLRLLESESSVLDQLNAAYRRLAPELKIKTAAYCETHKTKNLAIVVPRSSADPGVVGTEIAAFDADHISICKPANRHDDKYVRLYRHIAEFAAAAVGSAPAPTPTVEPGPLHSREISAFVYGERVAKSIYIVLPFDGEAMFAAPIRYIITTPDLDGAKNVCLHAELADSLYLHRLKRSVDKPAEASEIKILTYQGRTEHIARVLYKIPSIPPRAKIQLHDYLFADRPTIMSVPIRDRGLKAKIIVDLPITLILYGDDVLPWSGEVKINFRKGNIEHFAALKRDEDRLIKEFDQSGGTKLKPSAATFIGFTKYLKRPTADGLRPIIDADPDSIMAFNVRITPKGLEMHSKLSLRAS